MDNKNTTMSFSDTNVHMNGYYLYKETEKSGYIIVFSKDKYAFMGIPMDKGIPFKSALVAAQSSVAENAHNTMHYNIEDCNHIATCDGEILVLDNGLNLKYLNKDFIFHSFNL